MKKRPSKARRPPKRSKGSAEGLRHRFVEVDGTRIRCSIRGKGPTLLTLAEPGKPSALTNLLMQSFHVVALEIPSDMAGPLHARNTAAILNQAAAALRLEKYSLVAASAAAPVALWQAVMAQDRVDSIVLIAPRAISSDAFGGNGNDELGRALSDLKTPVLVLMGANEDTVPREAARAYAQRIPTSYVVLIYDAGIAIEAERPDVLIAAIRDFVEQGEKFVVNRSSTAINP